MCLSYYSTFKCFGGKFGPKIWGSPKWLKFGIGIQCYMLITISTFIIIIFLIFVLSFCFFCFPIWVFFQEHSRLTGQQGNGEGICLTLLYHVHPLHRHLDFSREITAEGSPLHIAGRGLNHLCTYCRGLTSAHSWQTDSNQKLLVSKRKLLTTKLRDLLIFVILCCPNLVPKSEVLYWPKFCTAVQCYVLITILTFIFSKILSFI